MGASLTTDSILEAVATDQEKRVESARSVTVHQLRGEATELLPPGSGAIIIAADSETFNELDHALASNDIGKINELVTENKRLVAGLQRVSNEQALATMLAAPVYGDLRYGGKTVAMNVFPVEGVGFTRVIFPFAGGTFDPNLFTFGQYTKDGSASLDVMVVVQQPTLNARERAVLRRLPAESRELVFGLAGEERMCGTPGALVATVTAGLLVAAVGTALGNCAPKFNDMDKIVLPAETLAMSPGIAVNQLVQARRQAFMR